MQRLCVALLFPWDRQCLEVWGARSLEVSSPGSGAPVGEVCWSAALSISMGSPQCSLHVLEALAIAGTYVREKQDPFTSEKEVPSTGIEEVSPGFFSLLYFRFHSSLFPSQ